MLVADEIRHKLQQSFAPDRLDVIDDSEAHRGHAGYSDGGQSHFNVVIRAPAFAAMTRLDRFRAVHKALGADLVGRIHALALDISG